MVRWDSPEEIMRDRDAFVKLIHVLAGIYFWEFAVSLDFDWSFIHGRKKFSWPMIPYFLTRYIGLGAMIGILLSVNITAQMDCQSLYMFISVATALSGGFASVNFAIRTLGNDLDLRHTRQSAHHWPLGSPALRFGVFPFNISISNIDSFGHTAIVKTDAFWQPGSGCISHSAANGVVATFISTLIFDFIVLSLCAYKLMEGNHKKSRLVNLLFKDGLIYFAVVFVASIPAAVIAFLNLNPVMDVIPAFPALFVHVIGSCRAVRRLSNFSSETASVYMTPTAPDPSTIAFRPHPTLLSTIRSPTLLSTNQSDGVQIQVDTFTTTSESEREDVGDKAYSRTYPGYPPLAEP
ncbi:hypothetical protein NLI96_g10062 [Meripilus lineatus]|uniref:Uncharacterized protein n=1 Tax=Meripilus lineatus TaxID=2056292 RepID=A0AAD5YCC5_9APHY|nr:hypothetical protein NLI96_g10062 [Physisporinus lineatus]